MKSRLKREGFVSSTWRNCSTTLLTFGPVDSTLSIFVTSGGTWGCSGTLSSEQFINVYQPSTEKLSQVNPDKTPSTVSPCGFTLFAFLDAGSLPVSRCAKYGIFVTASAQGKKVVCMVAVPICSWRTFRCQYGKVKDVIGLCFSETIRVRSLLDMASAHVVGNGWYSDGQSELSSLDMLLN